MLDLVGKTTSGFRHCSFEGHSVNIAKIRFGSRKLQIKKEPGFMKKLQQAKKNPSYVSGQPIGSHYSLDITCSQRK